MVTTLPTELRAVPALAQVPDEQLEWLFQQSEVRAFKKGERVFEPGQPSQYMYIVLSGRFRIYRHAEGKQRELGRFEAGGITGVLPYSRVQTSLASAEALEDARVMFTDRQVFREMIAQQYELTAALVHVMNDRIRNFTTLRQQNEKLMSLGKLSAGLAHELNNPAAALVRTSHELMQALAYRPESFKKVINMRLDPEVVDQVNKLLFEKAHQGPNEDLSLLQKTEKEDEIMDWLDDQDLEVNDSLVENFVDYGFEIEELEEIYDSVPSKEISPVLNWINQILTTQRMVGEISEASNRISELVKSVKAYTHMDSDQDRQIIDIHEGIINSVKMLKYKIKKGNLSIDKHFDHSIPKINAFPGELNQVWTNIIDNAIDAMEETGGILSIVTGMDGPCVKVEIGDTGKGIPPEVLSNIFDPFFTTKPQGKGTGLGLDVVHRIVEHHQADISVTSEPGKTVFQILFPVEE